MEVIPINPDRLSHGEWKGEKHIGEGDVPASYSGDRISEGKPIRQPFEHGGNLWICVSITGKGLTATGETEMQAYRIVPPTMFNGMATTYSEKVAVDNGEAARSDPLGFYNGMKIVCGGKPFIIRGPPSTFVADPEAQRPEDTMQEPQQMGLFT